MNHKWLLGIVFCLVILHLPASCPAKAPNEIAGFVLGDPIDQYKDRLRMDTAMSDRYDEYYEEVETVDIKGFKNGQIAYGTCNDPGHILRIRFKYLNSTREFFNELLWHYKEKFGEPDAYVGDPFHIVIAWKWSFTDEKKNKISLVLQHNLEDRDARIGNTVKLTMSSGMAEEALCHQRKRDQNKNQAPNKVKENPDWEHLLPR